VFGIFRGKKSRASPAPPAGPERLVVEGPDGLIVTELTFDRFSSLRISVRPGGVVRVRAPIGSDMAFVRGSVQARAEWIARHVARLAGMRPVRMLAYVQGEKHALLGREYVLDIRPPEAGCPRGVRLEGESIVVRLRDADPGRVRRALDAWYLDQSRAVFARVLRELWPRVAGYGAARVAGLKVRAMTSRWGTCSRAGVITLNRHLVRAPLVCVEYVAAHELCHLLHFGHGADFKALLTAVMPDWKRRRALLRRSLTL
jgi:predicted metal-dependent hydrolase